MAQDSQNYIHIDGLRLNPTIEFGDLLTIVTIFVSLFILLNEWHKGKALQRKERSDKIRNTALNAWAKLNLWREISLSMFQKIEISFVEASEMLKRDGNPEEARDFLWKELNRIKIENFNKFLEAYISARVRR
jgi:hypothetical protein